MFSAHMLLEFSSLIKFVVIFISFLSIAIKLINVDLKAFERI